VFSFQSQVSEKKLNNVGNLLMGTKNKETDTSIFSSKRAAIWLPFFVISGFQSNWHVEKP